jgi:hypothetical protein
MSHPIYTMPILMHWNLSLTFFPFVLVPVLKKTLGTGNFGPETTDLLKENSGNRKF